MKCEFFYLIFIVDVIIQVDLKFKICRGSSVTRILVREANAYSATHIIVGSSQGLHIIRPCISVARYCAKKLPKDCWVLAVDNGKIVFKREGSPATRAELKGFFKDFSFFCVVMLKLLIS